VIVGLSPGSRILPTEVGLSPWKELCPWSRILPGVGVGLPRSRKPQTHERRVTERYITN